MFGVSLEVGEVEVLTLLVHNGMGRSTTVERLFGMEPVRAGSFTLDGAPVAGRPSHRIARRPLHDEETLTSLNPVVQLYEDATHQYNCATVASFKRVDHVHHNCTS